MDANFVKEKLCGVIQEIQSLSKLPCPDLEGNLTPATELEGFSSKVWPLAAGMLAIQIGKIIPDDENLFYDADTMVMLTIDECIAKVLALPDDRETDDPDSEKQKTKSSN